MYDLSKVRCFLYRGGTSRGLFFHARDLPPDFEQRKEMFLALMGSPDIRQIDGLGGATSHTSKVVVMSPSKEEGIDVDYDFYQVGIENSLVDRQGMCGNLLAAAGLFAVDEGLVAAREPVTVVSVKNTNTGKRFLVHIPVKDGQSVTQGTHRISGVARPGACIWQEFIDPGGAVTGKLLPTGKVEDTIQVKDFLYHVSIVDASNPLALMFLQDVQLSGKEKIPALNSNHELLEHLEAIRGEAARLCGFVQEASEARTKSPGVPRLALVSKPVSYTTLSGQEVDASEMDVRLCMLSMQRFHQSVAGTAAICLAAAASIPGSIVNQIYQPSPTHPVVRIGNPSGVTEAEVEAERIGPPEGARIRKVVVSRTARRLMEGIAYYPRPKQSNP
jgi:2-methylaconitate cis-trans-isomerase PrpF